MMRYLFRRSFLCFPLVSSLMYCLFLFFMGGSSYSWGYDIIQEFNDQNDVYKEFVEKTQHPLNEIPTIFEYQLSKDEDLFTISKQLKISISALISLNRSSHRKKEKEGDYILIPSQKGIFLPSTPHSDLEFLLSKRLASSLSKKTPIVITPTHNDSTAFFVYFIPDMVLTEIEYTLWNSKEFRAPLLEGYITSYFGMRTSPITHKKTHHNGIDIASKAGMETYASRSGIVTKDGYNTVWGYYIIIQHDEHYSTLYGHLLDARVKVGDYVEAGTHIGYVGNTGASTGSHLHFEIRYDNTPIDPLIHLKL